MFSLTGCLVLTSGETSAGLATAGIVRAGWDLDPRSCGDEFSCFFTAAFFADNYFVWGNRDDGFKNCIALFTL